MSDTSCSTKRSSQRRISRRKFLRYAGLAGLTLLSGGAAAPLLGGRSHQVDADQSHQVYFPFIAKAPPIPPPSQELVNEAVEPFVAAMEQAGYEVNFEQVREGLEYREIRDVNGQPFIVAYYNFDSNPDQQGETLEGVIPLMILPVNSSEGWKKADIRSLCYLKGYNLTARIDLSTERLKRLSKDNVTKVKLEIGDPHKIFNPNFNWERIASNWDNIEQQLMNGIIPFEEEIFDPSGIHRVGEQVNYALSNGFLFVGDSLFCPIIFKDPQIAQMSPENQEKVLKFFAAARILKFPEITEIDLASEVAAWLYFRKSEVEEFYKALGEEEFLARLAVFVKTIKPDLKLIITEDLIIDPYNEENNPEYVQHYNLFFEMLEKLRELNAPIDAVKFENTTWIGAPPTEESITKAINKVKELGYEVAAPDTIVAATPDNPIWTNWPPTVEVGDNEAARLRQQAEVYHTILSTYLECGATELGLHSVTYEGDWLKASANIFDEDNQPKIAYYAILMAIFKESSAS